MAVNNYNYQVSWPDFTERSVGPAGINEDAQIHPEMSFDNFQLAGKGKAVVIKNVDINMELVANDCWVVASKKSTDLLKHEQGHFDILCICAREIYNSFLNQTGKSTSDLQSKIENEKDKLTRKVNEIDKRYDIKTDHSRNKKVQQLWDRKIDTVKKNKHGSLDDLPG